MKDMSIRDEIIDILKDVYYNNDQADPFEETYADLIIGLIVKRIDSLKEQLDSKNDTMMISTLNWLKEMMLKK